jgi:hypothetical protein
MLAQYLDSFHELYNKDINGAKFKIGERVVLHPFENSSLTPSKGNIFTIVSVCQIDKNVFEYGLEGFYALVWEEELERAEN